MTVSSTTLKSDSLHAGWRSQAFRNKIQPDDELRAHLRTATTMSRGEDLSILQKTLNGCHLNQRNHKARNSSRRGGFMQGAGGQVEGQGVLFF